MVQGNPATQSDLTSRSFRTLTEVEKTTGTTLLEDAWYMLIGTSYGPRILAEMGSTPPNAVVIYNVRRLLANAVLRVITNPDGIVEEEGDDYRAKRDVIVSSGRLYFLEGEIGDLFPAAGSESAWTITPSRRTTLRPPLPEDAFYEPLI